MNPTKTGHIKYLGFSIYYEVYGSQESKKTPLLVLHGGPGSAHNYMLGLAKLADNDRQVIFYDQLGCGESDMPDDESLWVIKTFVNEVKAIRKSLRLEKVHLLGHSWGGMLAIEYLLTKPIGIQSATLASSMISMPLYQHELDKIKRELPGNTYEVLTKHEGAGTTSSKEYQEAYAVYKKHYLYRGNNFPKEYGLADEKEGLGVYHAMWGPSESYGNGSLKQWDRIDELAQIKVPTLITSGQYDELTPWQAGITANQIPDSELRIFTNGSHLTHIEQEAGYLSIVERFLDMHDPTVEGRQDSRYFVA
jgi:proline-specific peptidase